MAKTVKKYKIVGHPMFKARNTLTEAEFKGEFPNLHALMQEEGIRTITKSGPARINQEREFEFTVSAFEEKLNSCQRCGAIAIVEVCGSTSNTCFMKHLHRSHDGYVLRDMGVGCEDYLEFDFCVECGQIQGEFPKRIHGRIVTKETEGYPYG